MIRIPPTMPDGAPWPRVTIVTPSYNQGRFLEETIRSVLLQGYPNLEYIVVDGGSTDESVDILRRYAPFLTYWVSEPDNGQSHAINKGLQRATGEILAYLNSDDLYSPNAIRTSVEFLHAHAESNLVYASARRIDAESVVREKVVPPEFGLRLLLAKCFIRQPTVFFHRRLVDRVGPFDESLDYGMDYDFWLRCTAVTAPRRLRAFTAADRFHAGAKSGSELYRVILTDVRIFDRLFSDGTLRPDAESLRTAYLPRLLFLAGDSSGASSAEQSDARERLRRFVPAPTVREIGSVIAGHDGYRDSFYLSHPSPECNRRSGEDAARYGMATGVSEQRQSLDAYHILRALVKVGLLTPAESERVKKELDVHAAVRAMMRPSRPFWRPTAILPLLGYAVRKPGLLSHRALWVELTRSTSLGRFLLPAFFRARDAGQRGLHVWKKGRRMAEARADGSPGH
jgi:GT2 family glycosyltransferase